MKLGQAVAAIGAVVLLAASAPGAAQAVDGYPPGVKPVFCEAYVNASLSKITLNMGPNQPGSRYYRFRIDVKRGSKWVRYKTYYRTKGVDERRTVNLRKGTYRARCYGKYGFTDTTSNTVKLKR